MNTNSPTNFQEDISHLNPPAARDASASHSENEEQRNSAISKETIEKSWKTIQERILETSFSKNFNTHPPSIIHKQHFGYKLRDFFPADMRKGCKKDISKNKAVDKKRILFASTTITNLKKQVEQKISDETQIIKAHGIITEFLLNAEILYLPKTLLHQILKTSR